VAGAALAARAQQPVFRGASDTVRVFATVTDRDGRLVTTLTRDAFEVRDEGKPQPITQFDNTPQPIRLIVMLDVSGSMAGNLRLLREASAQLFARLRPDDVARVGAFGHEVTISAAFTHDANELRAAVPDAIAPDAPTPLWRALDKAIEAFDAGSE
jgi:VWFA-related protein